MTDPFPARRLDLDTAKGIGMILVIIGHSRPPELVQILIYGVHMPLFFYISGQLWRGEVRLARSVRALWRPFVIASILSWLLWLVKQQLHQPDGQPLWGPLVATLWGGNLNGYLVHNTPLWFLPALLSIFMVLWLLTGFLSPARAAFALLMLGLPLLWQGPSTEAAAALPMSLGQGLVGGIFFALGYLSLRLPMAKKALARLSHPLAGAVITGLALTIAYANGRVDMYSLQFGAPLSYLASGALGSWGFTTLCRLPSIQLRSLCLIGRNSLVILAVHLPLLWLLRAALGFAGAEPDWLLLSMSCTAIVGALALWHESRPIIRPALSRLKDSL